MAIFSNKLAHSKDVKPEHHKFVWIGIGAVRPRNFNSLPGPLGKFLDQQVTKLRPGQEVVGL